MSGSAGGAMFLDRDRPPDRAAVGRAIGSAVVLYDELVAFVASVGGRPSWSWASARWGWELRCTRAGRPFVTLSARNGTLQALVVLGRAEAERVAAMPLSPTLRSVFAAATPFPDGRWLFLPVCAPSDAADVRTLLVEKLPPRVRARVTTPA